MAENWAEKHRPRGLDHVVGNPQAVLELRAWADSWDHGRPPRRAVLLAGPPGSGKTSAAHALAAERGWGVIELNASDARSAPAIQRVAGEGSRHETFSLTGEFQSSKQGQRKLIILDEADNLYERPEGGATDGEDFSDRGGKRAMVDTVVNTRQPIVLIVNDAYALTRGTGERFGKEVLKISFRHLTAVSVRKILERVAQAERVDVAPQVLATLAERSQGDARSAVNDLQALSEGRRRVEVLGDAFGDRTREQTMFDAVGTVFRTTDAQTAARALQEADETPDFLLLWLDENVPGAYRDPPALRRAYDWLSRADVLLGRVQRSQNYALWGYATELMGAGVATAKDRPLGTPPRYQFPSWLRRMGASKGERDVRKSLGAKLGQGVHAGAQASVRDVLPTLRVLGARDPDLAVALAVRLDLDEDELRYLLGPGVKESYADEVVRRVEARRAEAPARELAPAETAPPPEVASVPKESKGRPRSLLDF